MSKEAPNVVDKHDMLHKESETQKQQGHPAWPVSIFCLHSIRDWRLMPTYQALPLLALANIGCMGTPNWSVQFLRTAYEGRNTLADFFQCRFGQTCAVAYI